MLSDVISDIYEIVSGYFHYPIEKSKEYKKLRLETTKKYGIITSLLLVIILLSIPFYKYLIISGYKFTRKFSILKSLNSKLNHYIHHEHQPNCSEATLKQRIQAKVANAVKHAVFKLLLRAPTIFQIMFWTAFLSTLSLTDIHNGDLIFLAKRLGRVSANCLPAVLFLSLRPSPLPNTLYLTLLPIHKWLSRLIIVQAVIHTCLYCGYYATKKSWQKALKRQNLYGWASLFGFLVIIITSISKVRNNWFKFFYFNHYICAWLIVVCMQFHVRPVKFTIYTAINISILAFQIYYRLRLTKKSAYLTDVRSIDVSPNLSLIEFPNSLISSAAQKPGAHIRLTNYSPNFLVRVYKQFIPNYHPYTLVSLPHDNLQKLIIRKSTFEFRNNQKYLISGSYDPHLLFIGTKNPSNEKFNISKLSINAKRILIVIGGSAISFALPILRVMNYHGIPIKIVWVIKDFRDVIILKYFEGLIHGDDLEIFITGDSILEEERKLRNRQSIRSNFLKKASIASLPKQVDLENNLTESSPLLGDSFTDISDTNSLSSENRVENVDLGIDDTEEEESDDEDCTIHRLFHPTLSASTSLEEEDYDEIYETEEVDDTQHLRACHDIHNEVSSRKSSINEPFVPYFSQSFSTQSKSWVRQFRETIKFLNIEHKIYKGRPKLNNKYYRWCINEGFTQCTGPVEDADHNLVCCRDLPINKVVQEDINAEKIWVLSAGPRGLVDSVKLWASEYGLKFHEEAFYS
ncbi:putative ferric reductase transmembrane component 8 [Spathaspora sp. JA1]|nr:putative ferric reductase transmembrane component 8 [Spathaspora sp. JA1]